MKKVLVKMIAVIPVLAILALGSGCRAHPASLGVMLVGTAIHDADTQERFKTLDGKTEKEADEMFGDRLETLEVIAHPEHHALIYPENPNAPDEVRYIVETKNGVITALNKGVRNNYGLEDAANQQAYKDRIHARGPEEIEKEIGKPLIEVRNIDNNRKARIYDISNWADFTDRYIVLRFDAADKCENVRVVGVVSKAGQSKAKIMKEQQKK